MNTCCARWMLLPVAVALSLGMASAGWSQPFEPPGGGFGSGLVGLVAETENVVTVAAQFTARRAGTPAELFVTAVIKPGWHIYSITQPSGGPIATQIKLNPSDAYGLAGDFRPSPASERKRDAVFDNLMVETHHGTVTWRAPIELSAGIDPTTLKIEGALTVQPCDANSCRPPHDVPFAAMLSHKATAFDPDALVIDADEQIKRLPFWLAVVMGLLGGLILNLMPCVLPVIGLKLLSFIEQAGHDRRHAFLLNVWYSLGLLSVFLLLATLAVFAGFGWGQLFSLQGFNITLAAVVFVMGLSFLGVWEIPIPGFVGHGKVTELGEQEGFAGALSKGVLTTILATPCSAPFLAPALTWAVAQPPLQTYAIFTSVGVGMASPYLLIGAFPKLIRFLPKPGAWMETFKQIMGFVLLGTVVFLLTFIRWSYVVPTIGLLFGLWGACWWIGRVSPTANGGAKARAWLEAVTLAAVIWIFMFPGINGVLPGVPVGGLQEVMEARLQLTIAKGAAVPADQAEHRLPWQPFTRAALEELIAARKTVLVDFTANWCLTCKTLAKTVLNTSKVRELVDANGVATLHADWTDAEPEVTEMLELLGSKQVPVLAIFPAANPNRPIVLRGAYTQQTLLKKLREAGPSMKAS